MGRQAASFRGGGRPTGATGGYEKSIVKRGKRQQLVDKAAERQSRVSVEVWQLLTLLTVAVRAIGNAAIAASPLLTSSQWLCYCHRDAADAATIS
jgi:hypothetical protein